MKNLFKFFFQTPITNLMKLGDEVEMSPKNPNHLGRGVCAYSGMKGNVVQIWEDGAFCIKTSSSELIVTMSKRNKVWIFLNGTHLLHKKIK